MAFGFKRTKIHFSSTKLIIGLIFNRDKGFTQVNRSEIGSMQRKIVENSSQDLIQCFNISKTSENSSKIEKINLLPRKTKTILKMYGDN